jgi:hypothetical protein
LAYSSRTPLRGISLEKATVKKSRRVSRTPVRVVLVHGEKREIIGDLLEKV